MVLRLGIDLKIFHILANKASEPMSSADLSRECNAEELLLSMYLRDLVP